MARCSPLDTCSWLKSELLQNFFQSRPTSKANSVTFRHIDLNLVTGVCHIFAGFHKIPHILSQAMTFWRLVPEVPWQIFPVELQNGVIQLRPLTTQAIPKFE